MRIIAFVSLWSLISESTGKCPNTWNNLSCVCIGDISNPGLSCTVRNISDLSVLSNSYRHNLTTLHLRIDEFTVLPSSVLHYDNLTSLVIHAKNLTAVDEDAFADLEESLTRLTLSRSLLRKIPVSAIARIQNLANLDMERNKIVALDESLRSIPLRTLGLRRNKITQIGIDVLPESLTYLDLSYNDIEWLNGTLRGNLISLDVSNNLMESLDGVLNEVPKLEILIANDNVITNIDHCFSRVPQLYTLVLNHNYIEEIHNGLHGLINLRKLILFHNNLRVIDRGAFVDLKALETLNLATTSLKHLDSDLFSCLINLQKLSIKGNELRDLDFLVSQEALTGEAPDIQDICTFRHNTTLRRLNMLGSGIRCRRKTRPAIRYLVLKGVKIRGNPCSRRGQQLENLFSGV